MIKRKEKKEERRKKNLKVAHCFMSAHIPVVFLFSFFFFLSSFVTAQEFFWEEPVLFSQRQGSFPVSAHSGSLSVIAWQESSPNRDQSIAASGVINIRLAVKESGGNWLDRGVIAGPYPYSGTEPSILSIAIDSNGRIIIAAAAASLKTEILVSSDKGTSYTHRTIDMGAENSVAPRIFVRADGGYLLFVTRGSAQALSIFYSRSSDALTWSSFEPFTPENMLSLNFLPAHISLGRRDIVFFQSLSMGADAAPTFQLYYKTSDDGGRSWSPARRFTTFRDPAAYTSIDPAFFDNQRPHLSQYGENIFLVWERRYSTQSPQVYSAVINSNCEIIGDVERVNSVEAYCNNPVGFIYEEKPNVVWFDNRRGNNRIVIAQHKDLIWENQIVSAMTGESRFARPIVDKDGAYIFWQTLTGRDTSGSGRIYMLSPDRSADSPRITTHNFSPSSAGRTEKPRVSWNIPADTSGIFGFSWSWSQDENTVPQENVIIYNTGSTQNLNLELTADKEGLWYFYVSAQDFAGNWSKPSLVTYYKKTTPPPALIINEPELDNNGFIISNNFNLSWQPSIDPYVVGYTWNLQYLGNNEQAAASTLPSSIMGTSTSIRYNNQDNGFWAFSAAAIDQAGNIGPPSRIIFKANKFIPYTSVSYIDANQDEQGVLSIRVIGRGFSTNGVINSIALSQDGMSDIETSNFRILSDREISGITYEHIDEGQYTLKLHHTTRGWYNAGSFISVARTGTVKFGDYSKQWRSSWTVSEQGKIRINPVTVLAALLVVFCILGAVAAIRGIGGIILETAAIKQEAYAIITGDFMPMEKKQKMVKIQKKGTGLRFKLASFTIALVLLIIIGISTPMYMIMTNMQRDTLLQGLQDRSKVLLEGLASSARAYMPQGDQGLLELSFLPAQSSALPEAKYVTITGFRPNSIHDDHVLATNDPDIVSKLDTTEYQPGVSRITDALSRKLLSKRAELNLEAHMAVGDISGSIAELYQEGLTLALRTDRASIQRLNDIQTTVRALEVRLNESLAEIASEIGSEPLFSNENINQGISEFIFYKPVMYRQGADESYFRGVIRLEVSLESIMDAIQRGQMVLLRTIAIVAFIAVLIGITGAFILSTLIIRPIRKLVSHIEVIRDTEDKAKLAGVDIEIKSKDEIAILGNTINDMTHGLVKAALAASDLSIGKEIQKKFIPLEVDNHGNKQTSGFKTTPNLNFFGYYEGAKGVSGDYFDYIDLDGRYFAIIKCDVAGKGIPAALIMIQVATMFINHFKQWKPDAKGMRIEEVVYQINEFIETLAFKGRFAAFSLCIFDSATGVVRFCNAGDNIVHYYDVSEGQKKTITLPQTPATGVLPNFMIESTGGYSVQTVQIDKGDILLLYTDGIEESKRKFRNKDFKEMICEEGPADTPHENHLCGQADEEMSPERVNAIINAVMAKQVYTLTKYHNPEGEVELQFDFSSCTGTTEDVIMAMVSVEKMFRCYKSPNAGENDRVLVDKKVDAFLKDHFLQYRRYCSHTKEYPENPAYMYYTHVNEDEQYDDLTILGIKRK